jgi:hypothetical protein
MQTNCYHNSWRRSLRDRNVAREYFWFVCMRSPSPFAVASAYNGPVRASAGEFACYGTRLKGLTCYHNGVKYLISASLDFSLWVALFFLRTGWILSIFCEYERPNRGYTWALTGSIIGRCLGYFMRCPHNCNEGVFAAPRVFMKQGASHASSVCWYLPLPCGEEGVFRGPRLFVKRDTALSCGI